MEFWRFIGPDTRLGPELSGSYDPFLVVLSIAVACLAGLAALSVGDRILAATRTAAKRTWLVAGAVAMGGGIWAMHFTAMLAFSLPVTVSYKPLLTFISMLPAIFGSGVALHIVARETITRPRLQLGALLMAVGIGTMHYVGMEAMAMGGFLRYDFKLFVLSILVAHVLAVASLYVKFVLWRKTPKPKLWTKIASAIIMGHAVAAMHYTAMTAARFFPGSELIETSMGFHPLAFALTISMVTSMIIGITVVATMVERRLSEATRKLHETKTWANTVIDTSTDGIVISDQTGTIRSFNKAAEQLFGYRADEVIGQNLEILMPSPFRQAHAVGIERYLQTGETRIIGALQEVMALRKDGTTVSVELGVSEFAIESGRVFVGSLRDITERKKAEAEIESLARLAGENPGAVARIDRQGKILYANRSASKLMEAMAEESSERTVTQWSAIMEAAQAFRRQNDLEIGMGERVYSFDIVPIPETDYTNLYGTDITERKALEYKLNEAQKLESIGQLAAGIAHEINTPAQFVGDNTRFLQEAFGDVEKVFGIFAELIAAAKEGAVPVEVLAKANEVAQEADLDYLSEEVPRAIEQSLEGIERVSKIVRSMKEFAHPGTEEKTLTDLNEAIASTVTVSTSEWKYVAEMQTRFDPDLPPVLCFPGYFNQVILNMIVNAAHAIADVVGDGSNGKGTITIDTRRDGDGAEIRIADTGAGIPEENLPKIFDPFFTTKEVGKGTGQGLAISYSVIVDKHGGTLRVQSEVGKGTTFIIRLPLDPSESQREANGHATS